MAKKKLDIKKLNLVLQDWTVLNDFLRTASEEEAKMLLDSELQDRKRWLFMNRIFSRYNRMRAARERVELKKKVA